MITNFLDITIGTVNINIVFLGNELIWKRDKGLAKDYSGTGWYKALDTGIVYNKDVPAGETHTFDGDPKEYISVTLEDFYPYPPDRVATSNITNMRYLFSGDRLFDGDISHWDTSNVTDMSSMFSGAKAFNQDISKWDTSKVTNMDSMFLNCVSFNQDLSGWCVPLIETAPNNFDLYTYRNWQLPRPVWGTCPRGENTPV